MNTIILDVIMGDAMINRLMHAADTFESSKILGEHSQLELVGNPNVFTLAKTIADGLNESGKIVSFVGLKLINGKPIWHGTHYFKPGLRTISTGRQWGVARDMIRTLGYEVETDETLVITNVQSLNE